VVLLAFAIAKTLLSSVMPPILAWLNEVDRVGFEKMLKKMSLRDCYGSIFSNAFMLGWNRQ
jgi:hypothetical protein